MKRIITAMGNKNLNEKIKQIEDIEVIDIFYREGILEYLEKDSNIDIIILNEELCEDELENILKEIEEYEIKVFLLVKKLNCLEDFSNYNNVQLFKDEDEIVNFLENKDYVPNNIDYKFNNKRIISIIGNYGVGKTVFCSLLGKVLSKKSKVLLINFDIFSDNLNYLFNLKNSIKSYDMNSLITKACKNLYVLNGIKYIFNETNKINGEKVKTFLEELKKNFEYILIDTSSEISLKFIKTIFPNCDYNVFLVEANSLELKKAKDLLEIYVLDFNLNLDKTGIFINKYNISSIDMNIVKNILNDVNIIGKMNYTSKINSYINTCTKNNIKVDDINKLQKYLKGVRNDG